MQHVCSQLPLCQITEEELNEYPEFTNLLREITKHVDESGLSRSLRKDLDMVQNELRLQQKTWLEYEVVHRLLQEMLQEYHCKRREKDSSRSAKDQQGYPSRKGEPILLADQIEVARDGYHKFYETLNQCMLVAECTRFLDPSPNPGQDMVPLLGLEKDDLLEFLPDKLDVQHMRESLQKELEARLQKKCVTLLSLYESKAGYSERLKCMKTLQLLMTLQDEKRLLQSETTKCKENAALIEKQKMAFPPLLLRCLSLLQQMATDCRLSAQADIDRRSAEYLEKKLEAMRLKIEVEEKEILNETYSPAKLEVHKVIRDKLESAISNKEAEVIQSRALLENFEHQGPEFKVLAEEYIRLKKAIDSNKWALAELNKSSQ